MRAESFTCASLPRVSRSSHQVLFGFPEWVGGVGRKEFRGDEEDGVALIWLGTLGPSRHSNLILLCALS